MFDVVGSSPSVVRFINVKNSEGVKRIRVNVIYERGLQTNLATLSGQRSWLDDASPPLDFEGYEDEVPEWGGAEQEVSSGMTEWADCGEQDDEAIGLLMGSHAPETIVKITVGTFRIASRCFGDRQIFRRQDPEVIACLNDILNYVCDGTPLHASKRKTDDAISAPVHHLSGYLSGEGVSNAALVEPAFNVRLQPRNTCRLCFETNVKHLERHVLQHHIKKPMYLCPYCNFSSCYSPASVKDHIKTRHSMYDPVPIDMRDEYTELIQSVYDQCFLDDPNTFLNRFLLRQVCNFRLLMAIFGLVLGKPDLRGRLASFRNILRREFSHGSNVQGYKLYDVGMDQKSGLWMNMMNKTCYAK
ncbi:hypothetical protein Aduo_012212 [Ancylostoma duodenale]